MDVHARLNLYPSEKVSKEAERNKTEKSEATETEKETPMNSFVFL